MILKQVFFILLLLSISLNLNAQQNTNPPPPSLELEETTEQDLDSEEVESFADEEPEQNTEEINIKTAEEINAKAEKLLEPKKSHTQVVPYYSETESTPILKKITKKGEKIYATKKSEQKYLASLSMGPFFPANLEGDVEGITYSNVYDTSPKLMAIFNIEWQFFKSAGKMGFQSGVGLFGAQGFGRFTSRPSVAAEESISLLVLPVQLNLVYRMHYWDMQPIIPFGAVGGIYHGMVEIRDDKSSLGENLKFGGGAAWQWLGGVQIMLDGLDKEVLWQLDQDYGINHVYLTANIRQIFGLSNIYDFSALYYEGGFGFEF
ncbi:MAG: hypothetical protein IPM57_10950 [Oligoflexia bacterium]|nr:hypothetical protein [Oligoflexia bacterium]